MTNLDKLVCVKDFEDRAAALLEKHALEYFKTVAGHGNSFCAAKDAYLRVKLKPRVLRNVSKCSVAASVLGGASGGLPIGISPWAVQKVAHPEGEVGSARAAEAAGAVFVLSTMSTVALEEVAAAAPRGRNWLQTHIYKDRKLTEQLVKRAERAGFQAVVITVDAPVIGIRYQDARNQFTLPSHFELANFKNNGSIEFSKETLLDASVTWKDIKWLKTITALPIILKGILCSEDAALALQHNIDGIIVSSHGGRQLDTVPAPLEVLAEIVNKLKGSSCEVYVDGGISTGSDVFKALAVGAKMALIGRPAVWGLTCGGQQGVQRVLDILKTELETTMVLSGVTSVAEINRNYVRIPPDWTEYGLSK